MEIIRPSNLDHLKTCHEDSKKENGVGEGERKHLKHKRTESKKGNLLLSEVVCDIGGGIFWSLGSGRGRPKSPVPYFEIMEEFFFWKEETVLHLSIFYLFKIVKVDENTCSVQSVFILTLTLFFPSHSLHDWISF